ncbi:MAG: hypothetical protein E7634_00020 [Ruminococcaceae bacterium]|nr:hypothetical protein [Oscillospiraceae bacterium]
MALICVSGAKECSGCRTCKESDEDGQMMNCSVCGCQIRSEKALEYGAFIDLCRSCYNALKHGGI